MPRLLRDLLDRVAALGVRIERLLLDRGFASVAILAWRQDQPVISVVALPKRGQRLKALLTGKAGYRTTYTMHLSLAHASWRCFVAGLTRHAPADVTSDLTSCQVRRTGTSTLASTDQERHL